ncbi:MAG: peptidylprolyl isomerase [bacterium]
MRRFTVSILFVLMFVVIFSSPVWAKIINKPVAIVNGEIITAKEFKKLSGPVIEQYEKVLEGEDKDERLKALKKDLLNQLIEERLLIQEAKNKDVRATDIDIDDGIEEIKKNFDSDEEFKAELKKQDLSEKQFREKIKESLLVRKLIEKEVEGKIQPPSDEKVKKYYDEHEKEFERPYQIRVRHILIRVDKSADLKEQSRALNSIRDIQRQLKGGADFEALAKKFSEDPGSKDKGGDVGFFGKGMMVKEFEEIAFKMKKGETSDVVKTDFGYHIIRFEESQPSKQLVLEDELELGGPAPIKVKDFIKETIYRGELQTTFIQWIDSIKNNAKIEIKEEEL